jgi:hypothetical protein
MQIEIKTLQNIRDGRVKLEIILDETAAPADDGDGMTEMRRANDAETRVAELETTENALRNRIINLETDRAKLEAELERERKAHVCTERCTKNAHVAMEGRQRVTKLEEDLATQTKRADLNKEWAERAEARLAEVEKIVNSSKVQDTMESVTTKVSAGLAHTIRDVRAALTSQQ